MSNGTQSGPLICAAGMDVDAMPPDRLMQPASVAEAYWQPHRQTRDAWSFEVDLRPWCESRWA